MKGTPMTDHFDKKAQTWDLDPVRAARAVEVARQIMERVEPTRDMDVLDFGSGTGLLGFQLLPHVASVTFADPSEGMLREVTAKLRAAGHEGGRDALLSLVQGMGLERVQVSSAWAMQLERPEGTRTYSLFLLTAQRPLRTLRAASSPSSGCR